MRLDGFQKSILEAGKGPIKSEWRQRMHFRGNADVIYLNGYVEPRVIFPFPSRSNYNNMFSFASRVDDRCGNSTLEAVKIVFAVTRMNR